MFSQEYRARWSTEEKLIFRFLFCYFSAYIFLLFFSGAFESIIRWVGESVFQVSHNYDQSGYGSGDNTFAYLTLFVQGVITILAFMMWTVLDGKRPSYNRLGYWFVVVLRVVLIGFMLLYGLAKVFLNQFGEISLRRLVQPLGDFSPMGLAWTYMAYSPGFQFFTGMLEVLGALLLIPRRTHLLGAFVVFGVMTHVMAMNFMFDIPVKLFSTHLVLMAGVILLTHLRPLSHLFVLNKSVSKIDYFFPFESDSVRLAFRAIKVLLLLGILTLICIQQFNGRRMYGALAEKPLLYGIWSPDVFVVNQDTIPPLLSDTVRWKYLIVDRSNRGIIQSMQDEQIRCRLETDSLTQKMDVESNEGMTYMFSYDLSITNSLHLTGKRGSDSMNITLHRIPADSFLLKARGFHWINERPFNR